MQGGTANQEHVRYDFNREQASDLGESEFEREIGAGIRQSNWFVGFAIAVTLVWGVWTLIDLAGQFSLTFGTLKPPWLT